MITPENRVVTYFVQSWIFSDRKCVDEWVLAIELGGQGFVFGAKS